MSSAIAGRRVVAYLLALDGVLCCTTFHNYGTAIQIQFLLMLDPFSAVSPLMGPEASTGTPTGTVRP